MIPTTQKKQATSAFGNAYLFTARRFDEKTGAYYYRNRYYEPRNGQLLSRDPLGYEDSFNLYTYVLNSPINLIDPKGLKGKKPWPCDKGPEITVPENIFTYVRNLEGAEGRTAVIYNVFVCCLCEDNIYKIKVYTDVHYLIKIENQYQATRLGGFIYGHELRHIASIKQAINNSAKLRNEIRRQTSVIYGYPEGCDDNLKHARSKVFDALLAAIKTGAGHDNDPTTTRPAEGEEIAPGGPVPPPASSEELKEYKQKLKGYRVYDPK